MTWTLVGPIGTTNHSLYRCSECKDTTEGGVFHVEPKLCGVCAMQALNKQLDKQLENLATDIEALKRRAGVIDKAWSHTIGEAAEDAQLLDLFDECGLTFTLCDSDGHESFFESDPLYTGSRPMRDLLRGAPAALEALDHG